MIPSPPPQINPERVAVEGAPVGLLVTVAVILGVAVVAWLLLSRQR